MAKTRICKVCGKEYEYCGHCPSKNVIEPWRNLYCSENCRDAYVLFEDYVLKRKDALEVKEQLQSWGLTPAKVRSVHKPVVSEIFKNGTVIEPPKVVQQTETPIVENPVQVTENKPKKPYFDRKKKNNNNIVNDKD